MNKVLLEGGPAGNHIVVVAGTPQRITVPVVAQAGAVQEYALYTRGGVVEPGLVQYAYTGMYTEALAE